MDVLGQCCASEYFNGVTNNRSPNYHHHLNNLNNDNVLGREIVIEDTNQDNSVTVNSPDIDIDDETVPAQMVDLTLTSDMSVALVENHTIECTNPQLASTLKQSCVVDFVTAIKSLIEDTKFSSLVGAPLLLDEILHIVTCPVSHFQ